jgi:hypothetical protein
MFIRLDRMTGVAHRTTTLIIGAYVVATVVLLTIAGTTLVLAEGLQRHQLVGLSNTWFVGMVWLSSAVAAIALAYRLRARMLAVAIAGSFLLTAVLIYSWASAIALSGAGAWDVLRGVTGGGLYPIVAVALIVATAALGTMLRNAGSPQPSRPAGAAWRGRIETK